MSRKGGLPTGFRGAEASQPHLFRNPLHKCCTRKAKRLPLLCNGRANYRCNYLR